jgi:hypothetical protein
MPFLALAGAVGYMTVRTMPRYLLGKPDELKYTHQKKLDEEVPVNVYNAALRF